MAATAGPDDGSRYGFTPGQEVQEFGYDDDVDQDIRVAIETTTGNELVDEDYHDVVDGSLVWWRADDAEHGDLTDLLVDVLANLDNGGYIALLTPKAGREGHVSPAEMEDAARTAGLQPTGVLSADGDWNGVRLLARQRGH